MTLRSIHCDVYIPNLKDGDLTSGSLINDGAIHGQLVRRNEFLLFARRSAKVVGDRKFLGVTRFSVVRQRSDTLVGALTLCLIRSLCARTESRFLHFWALKLYLTLLQYVKIFYGTSFAHRKPMVLPDVRWYHRSARRKSSALLPHPPPRRMRKFPLSDAEASPKRGLCSVLTA